MDRKISLTISVLLIMISLAAASYLQVSCSKCTAFKAPGGCNPTVWCKHDDSKTPPEPVCSDCILQCAKTCGEATRCIETVSTPPNWCETCCNTQTCQGYPAYNIALCYIPLGPFGESCACQNACIGTCRFNTNFCYMVLLIFIVGGMMAAIMLLLLALKWIISDDPQGRTDARRGIWYVIVGIIIIVSASALVGTILGVNIPCSVLP